MSRKQYRVFLNGKKRSILKKMISTGTNKARVITRARILLLANESPKGPAKKDREIMDSLGVSARTVAIARQRFAFQLSYIFCLLCLWPLYICWVSQHIR